MPRPAFLFGALALATLSGSLSAQSPLTITNSPPGGYVNIPYNFQFTASGGVKPYSWQWFGADCGGPGCMIPPGLTMNSAGLVTGTPTLVGDFQVQVSLSDQSMGFAFQNYTISIRPCSFNFNTDSALTSGDVGAAYSQAINITAIGCTAPYSFTVAAIPGGSQTTLPPGLTINAAAQNSPSAVISGTPTTANTYPFNLTVTEANKASATTQFSITINPALAIAATSPLPAATVGQAYSQSLLPSGGTPPYFAITLDNPPPGMTLDSPTGVLHGTPPKGSVGTYTFTATLLDSVKAQASKQFQLAIVAAQPLLQVTPTALTFSAVAGGDVPPAQALSVAPSTAAAATFTVVTDGGQPNTKAPFALIVKPASGSAPAQLMVSVDQGSLQAGSTSGRIRVLDQNGGETDVTVNLNVVAANVQLLAAPPSLRFSARVQSPGTLEQDLAITNSGGGGPAGFSAAALNGSSWISSITPASGQTARNTAVFARVLVNTQGLKVGSYSDTVRITYSGGNIDVPVFLFVANSGAILGTNVTGLRYQAQQGGGFSNTQTVKILNLGDSSTTINWTAKLVSGSDFVSLGATSGTATTTKPGLLPVNLTSNATQLSAGGHYALISITDPNAQNSPAYVVVVLDLAAAGAPALPDPNPAGLFFAVAAAGATSAAQTVNVNTSSSQAVPFQVAPSTADGGAWLSLSQTSGQASGQNPGAFTVSVNPASLKAGIYSGQVSVSIGAAVRVVNVTVVVLPAGSTVPSGSAAEPIPSREPEAVESPRATTCTPSKLALTETGLVNNFSVPAKWPATLIVQLNDDCANAVTNGAVVASFSNGDSPVSLKSGGQGANYSATWQPSTTSSQMVVTLNATAGTLTPASMQLVGGVAGNQTAAPVLTTAGTVNAFYRVSGGPLSPGTIVEVYGSGLGVGASGTGSAPLPLNFNGTSVLVGGLSAPLFYVSAGQLDVQIPSELAANQQFPILVSANGAVTLPDQLTVVPLQPTVDALTDGHLVAQHGADSSLVTADHPAKPGEAVVVYLLGMGPTSPSVPSGAASPTDPLAMVTAQPAITVDNEPASVLFAGLTPQLVGLYQVDFIVPADARSGDLTVTISQNGVLTNTTKLPVAQ